jgi:hypothetical protein
LRVVTRSEIEQAARLRPVVEAARRFIHDGENNEPIVQLEKALAQAVYELDRLEAADASRTHEKEAP